MQIIESALLLGTDICAFFAGGLTIKQLKSGQVKIEYVE